DQFSGTMSAIHDASDRDSDIYIVAHSEGTVVSLLGLMTAFCSNPIPHWVKRIKGLMTIGSPLDKHLLLWPELWTRFESHNNGGDQIAMDLSDPYGIKWLNYYDNGDPIAFDLAAFRRWMRTHGWNRAFDFSDSDDIGFSRYYFPGKAHLDYW